MFEHPRSQLKVGRVLQFCIKESKKQLMHKGNYATITNKIGVLCTLYSINDHGLCTMIPASKAEYFPTSNYICTLTEECIQSNVPGKNICTSLGFTSTAMYLPETFHLTRECLNFVQMRPKVKPEIIVVDDFKEKEEEHKNTIKWIQFEKELLTTEHKKPYARVNG